MLSLLAAPLFCAAAALRPPAVPLVVTDPYFSIWSTSDKLADSWPSHWNGHPAALHALLRVGNATYRLMGPGSEGSQHAPAFPQVGVAAVTATRTTYAFAGAGLAVSVSFLTPAIASDPSTIRPLTLFEWTVAAAASNSSNSSSSTSSSSSSSAAAAAAAVELYFDLDAELCTNSNLQKVEWGRPLAAGSGSGSFDAMRMGSAAQTPFTHAGLSNRIDWGHIYAAVPRGDASLAPALTVLSSAAAARGGFVSGGAAGLPTADDTRQPRAVSDDWPVAAVAWKLGAVGQQQQQQQQVHRGVVLLAYDDVVAVELDGVPTPGAWRGGSPDAANTSAIAALLGGASGAAERAALAARCAAFDAQLAAELEAAGGPRYAAVGALAYRQTLGAHALVRELPTAAAPAATGELAHLSRECGSGDDILTLDVIIDSLPFFLHFGTALLRAQLRPLFKLAANRTRYPWPHAYAPHDLGKYPVADAYNNDSGAEMETMPVEETGNALVMVLAIAQREGGSTAFADEWWLLLGQWAQYLLDHGLYPAKQLSSDDFDGPLANRTNLAAKAIVGIAAYGALCEMKPGCDAATAARFSGAAAAYVQQWLALARSSDADAHLKLCYGCDEASWGMQYSLWFDRLLGLRLFPDGLYAQLKAFFAGVAQPYGLPLDPRHNYTIQPWQTWMYSLPGYSTADFEAVFEPTARWVDDTPDRVPLSDWYHTDKPARVGFEARSMWGGIYSRLLTH